jgi:hypothetical protein
MKNMITMMFLAAFSTSMYFAMIQVADRITPLGLPKNATMARIDSIQGLTQEMKQHAFKRLASMSKDSVEIIKREAGF